MKNIEESKIISRQLREKAHQSKQYKDIIRELGNTDIQKITNDVILLCLTYEIDCETLIECSADYKENKITEEELKNIIYAVLN